MRHQKHLSLSFRADISSIFTDHSFPLIQTSRLSSSAQTKGLTVLHPCDTGMSLSSKIHSESIQHNFSRWPVATRVATSGEHIPSAKDANTTTKCTRQDNRGAAPAASSRSISTAPPSSPNCDPESWDEVNTPTMSPHGQASPPGIPASSSCTFDVSASFPATPIRTAYV